jgi:TPP-dependent pyruvate/acetoin dehydrogenase alpha subunit
MARKDGPTGGREANTQFGDVGRGVIAPTNMLGGTVPLMAGIALAAKLRKERRVAVTYVGDGATSTGPCHEGMNFAAVLKVPLLIIVENNGWAYSTPTRKQMAIRDIAERGKAYGIPARIVDGNEVLQVFEATREAAEHARGGGGPVLIECKTMRMKGHAEHDDARYVPQKDFEKWRRKDPIFRFEKYLAQHKLMTEEEKGAIEARIEKEICDDVAFAESSPFPQPEEAAHPVWA